jgi:FlaA1/EpsC-like NDP-sugar epimerase
LRFEDAIRQYDELIVESLPVVIVCQVAAFWLFRVHHGMWRYTSVRDVWAIARAAFTGTAAAVVVFVFVYRFHAFSRAVFVIDGLLLIGFVSAARLSMRLLTETFRPTPEGRRRVLIYGAGEGGLLVYREMTRNPSLGRVVVGFLDDDTAKQHRTIEGMKVLGGCDNLDAILDAQEVEEVLLASAAITPACQRLVAEVCERRGVEVLHA